jgi:hypothetical protein
MCSARLGGPGLLAPDMDTPEDAAMELLGKDCLYLPATTTGVPTESAPVSRLLVVGTRPEAGHLLAPDVRVAAAPPSGLEVGGFFAFRELNEWHGLYVQAGPRQAAGTFAFRHLEDHHWAFEANQWLQFLWERAAPETEPTLFKAADQVLLVRSDRVGTIKSVSRAAGRSADQVWSGSGDTRSLGDDSLLPLLFDDTGSDHRASRDVTTKTASGAGPIVCDLVGGRGKPCSDGQKVMLVTACSSMPFGDTPACPCSRSKNPTPTITACLEVLLNELVGAYLLMNVWRAVATRLFHGLDPMQEGSGTSTMRVLPWASATTRCRSESPSSLYFVSVTSSR